MGATEAGSEKFQVSASWFGPSMVILRVLMGWHFLYAGLVKVLNPGWTSRGFLLNAIPEGNPIAGFWPYLADNWFCVLDPLNAWGLTLIGAALILGAFVRWSAFWGGVMMLFYWAASLPLANSYLIDDHVIYIAVLFGLGAFGAGRYYGLDEYLEELSIVQDYPRLRYLLG